MDTKQILKFCLEKGLLVDKDVLNLFNETSDTDSVKLIIEKIKNYTKQNVITKNVFYDNKDKVNQFFYELPQKNQKELENLKIKLGLSIEISREKQIIRETGVENISEPIGGQTFDEQHSEIHVKKYKEYAEDSGEGSVKVLSSVPASTNKKIEVQDFVTYFKNRFIEMRGVLQNHSELDNLVSISKIFGSRQKISIIGMIADRAVTKNKNIIFEVEDTTGRIKVLINKNKKEIYEKAENAALDSVVGFKGSGNEEIFFADDIIYPDSTLPERKNSTKEECVLFIGDLHFGSKRFMKENFLKFIDYLNGNCQEDTEYKKIKYLFLVGDVVTGVGNYPNQERDLEIVDLEEQFLALAELLGKIRKDIKIIISPGNHDGVRLMEPQPFLDEKYSWPLYEMENVFITPNPCYVNIGEKADFSGFTVLTYHGFSYPYYANNIPSLIQKRAMNCPEEIMKYLLKNRHLAPTHASTQYYPLEKDGLFIREIPDIFVSAHTHKCGVSYYNNILVVSISCWEEMTPYQEKFGNIPDHCKVPMFNLKTRKVKILDFEDKGEENKEISVIDEKKNEN
jgi:DNA polymerase II small subunit